MGMFAGIEEVTAKKESRFPEPGTYTVSIEAIRKGVSERSCKPYFVAELAVVESNNPDFVKGDTITWMTMVHSEKHYFLADVKTFIATATGLAPEEVTEEVVEHIAGEGQPLCGQGLRLRAEAQTAKKSGKSFIKSVFTKVDLDFTMDDELEATLGQALNRGTRGAAQGSPEAAF